MSEDVFTFPTRFRGYDRDAVDQELHELRTALDYAQAERDRAVARALALENGVVDQTNSQTSATVQWLIDTAEQDARRIRAEAEQAATEHTQRAEELLRHRIELIEQAQHEADVCRAEAAEEARAVVHDALEKANALLHGLQESEAALRVMFDSGTLTHRMPPPRHPAEEEQPVLAAAPATVGAQERPTAAGVPQPFAHQTTTTPSGGRRQADLAATQQDAVAEHVDDRHVWQNPAPRPASSDTGHHHAASPRQASSYSAADQEQR